MGVKRCKGEEQPESLLILDFGGVKELLLEVELLSLCEENHMARAERDVVVEHNAESDENRETDNVGLVQSGTQEYKDKQESEEQAVVQEQLKGEDRCK